MPSAARQFPWAQSACANPQQRPCRGARAYPPNTPQGLADCTLRAASSLAFLLLRVDGGESSCWFHAVASVVSPPCFQCSVSVGGPYLCSLPPCLRIVAAVNDGFRLDGPLSTPRSRRCRTPSHRRIVMS